MVVDNNTDWLHFGMNGELNIYCLKVFGNEFSLKILNGNSPKVTKEIKRIREESISLINYKLNKNRIDSPRATRRFNLECSPKFVFFVTKL